ncbi:MAG: bifunctional 4-hydroxy-2-oxoglutarate aldolase/2-dehydro-3-deoxy-phosphogluconate aldolase [Deltaproteobacteria bacterium]|jgi:2-dehydro-3-deoxyphosphogluconate aldolase / (4S)-4-hydroxy-2-oxoglutarate aldolase
MNQRHWKIAPEMVMRQGPVIPVMVIERLEHAVPMAKALLAGGVRVLEITLRTPAALDAIAAISREVPDAIVGAGTVTSEADLKAVTLAGAVFAISPGLTPRLLETANRGEIALIPGIATVSELMTGIELGYDHFKFFPAQVAGGVQALKAIAGPFPRITFCPTGGITFENYRDYLALKNVACVGGSWLCTTSAVEHQDWDSITKAARAAVDFNAVDRQR